jgi:hypothetical protein
MFSFSSIFTIGTDHNVVYLDLLDGRERAVAQQNRGARDETASVSGTV